MTRYHLEPPEMEHEADIKEVPLHSVSFNSFKKNLQARNEGTTKIDDKELKYSKNSINAF
jgi:hypothetical protein